MEVEPSQHSEEHGETSQEHGETSQKHGETSQKHGKSIEKHGKSSEEHGETSEKHGETSQEHGETSQKSRQRNLVLSKLREAMRRAEEGHERLETIEQSLKKYVRPVASRTGWLNYFWPKWGGTDKDKDKGESEALDRSLAATRTAIWDLRRSVEDTMHSIDKMKWHLMEREEEWNSYETRLMMEQMQRVTYEMIRNENESIKDEIKSIKKVNEMIRYENESIKDEIKSIKKVNEKIRDGNESMKCEVESIKTDIDCRRSTELWQVPVEPWRGEVSYDEWVTDDAIGHTEWACKESGRFSGEAPCYTYLLESANSVGIEGALRVHLLIVAGPDDSLLDWPFSAAVTLIVAANDHPAVYSEQTRQCRIERPPDERYRCRHVAPFEFPHAALRTAGMEMSHGVRVSCQIVPGEDLV